ncbi:hypothetical protein CPAV1605_1521 [seawater metagenome]|uniref:Uncharacterized protein n=1 Tax=seawater metagenome TaxID=1561972 RepID=A0A5E8CM83_9ZZZZ
MPTDQKKELKNKIKKYVMCEKEIKRLNEEIKKVRKIKDEISPEITYFMEKQKLNELSINKNYIIKLQTQNTFQGISKGFIQERLSKYLKNDHHGQKITDFIYDSRFKKEKKSISLTELKKESS